MYQWLLKNVVVCQSFSRKVHFHAGGITGFRGGMSINSDIILRFVKTLLQLEFSCLTNRNIAPCLDNEDMCIECSWDLSTI